MERRLVKLTSVVIERRWQARVFGLDEQRVTDYAAFLEAGGEFDNDPTIWIDEDGRNIAIHGFHRLQAFSRVGRDEIYVNVFSGSREEAEWESRTANMRNGLPLSLADRRVLVEWALIQRPMMSDREIARTFMITHVTVGNYRRKLEEQGRIDHASVRKTADGRVMNVEQIGAARPAAADPFAAASVPPSSPYVRTDVEWRNQIPVFVRTGKVVVFTQSSGDVLAVVTGECSLLANNAIRCPIQYKIPGEFGLMQTANVPPFQLLDPFDRFVKLPNGIIGRIQSVREDRLSVTYPNGSGGNQTNTLLWTNCELVLLATGQKVITRTGRRGVLTEDQSGELLMVRDIDTDRVSQHPWRSVTPVNEQLVEPVPAAEEPQAEPVEDDLSFADDLVDAFMEMFTGEDIQEIIPSLAIALSFAEGSGVASPTVIQHIQAVASWFSDIAHTARAELMKQNAPAG